MSTEKISTPGAIGRKGTFLWQMDSPSGSGLNLWSGQISPNNGYPEEHALRAAILFEAAQDLVEALQELLAAEEAQFPADYCGMEAQVAWALRRVAARTKARDAMLKARGGAS